MSNLLEHTLQSIRRRWLLKDRERVLVAVSGGVDSMVLLHLLNALTPQFDWKLTVAHFNHQLRGRASDADERFVKRSAKSLGLKTVVGRGDVKHFAQKHRISIEMAARELRHEFFAKTARRLNIRTVALAHHANDQMELFFLRLLRGSGGEALAGMKWRSPSPTDSTIQIVRPLLDAERTELELFARKNHILFREDASNLSLDVRRNRIRHELLPLLKKHYQPALRKTLLRAMEIFGAESDYVTKAAEQWLGQKRPSPFDSLHIAVQRQCLVLQLERLNVRPDFDLIEQLRESTDQRVSISPVLSLYRDATGLVQIRPHSPAAFNADRIEIELDSEGEEVFNGVRCWWKMEACRNQRSPSRAACRELFDSDSIGHRIVLRHWRAGDRFQPIGMNSPVKLQDWFTNQRIPREQRHLLLVAESAYGEIFWVEGLRISENFKLTPQTRRRLVWRWRR